MRGKTMMDTRKDALPKEAHFFSTIRSSFEAPRRKTEAREDILQQKSAQGWGHNLAKISINSPLRAGRVLAGLHARLAISQPGDEQEVEAERIADQIMTMPETMVQQNPLVFREEAAIRQPCPWCKRDKAETLNALSISRSSARSGCRQDVLPIVHEVLNSPGEKLNDRARMFLEPRFGHDFSMVRVHTDAKAEESAKSLNALAYTAGANMAFAAGQYAPNTARGIRLLAHELTHYLQQQNEESGTLPNGSFQGSRNDEYESLCPLSQRRVSCKAAGGPLIARQSGKGCACSPQSVLKASVGANGMFPSNQKTQALRLWDYVVYSDHVRLGNRKISEGVVIGSWPWMTNNPGDITVDVHPRMQKPGHPSAGYWQNVRAWGSPAKQGPTPDNMSPVSGDRGLSPDNTAVEGFAARKDLAIFVDLQRGRRALKEWVQKYSPKATLKNYVSGMHLGPIETHTSADDPEKYWKWMQQYLSSKKYPSNYVTITTVEAVKDDEWNDVLDAFGFVEGFYSCRPVAGTKNKFQYVENKGIVYRCSGRDPIDVDPAFKDHEYVKKMPETTPPEIRLLLGCVDECPTDSCQTDQEQSSSPTESQGASEDTSSTYTGGAGGAGGDNSRSNESGGSRGSGGGT